MPHELSAVLDGKGLKIAIAAARFNAQIVDGLLGGALDGLRRHGVADSDITVVRCPGSWELPLVCRRLATGGAYHAVIALGCVIRGDTPHFDYVAGECAKGLGRLSDHGDVPVIFGVLTTDTVDQALNRAGLKHGNKGWDCALGAIEMCRLSEQL